MKKINFAVINFPGSNCEKDCFYVIKKILKHNCDYLWHQESIPNKIDCLIIPGGFSYGDYLRTGSIASQSKIANKIIDFANKGGSVIGICNGFQILTELKLLPGTLLKNKSLKFLCKDEYLKINNKSRFTSKYKNGEVIKLPIAHAEGNYYADKKTIKELVKNNQIIFSYSREDGKIDEISNPNGSIMNIAGIMNKKGNVIGMMPHPERACESIFNNTMGLNFFKSIIHFHNI